MIVDCPAIATKNPALWGIALQEAIAGLPVCVPEINSSALPRLTQGNTRVARAALDAEMSLVELLLPIVRGEIESGRLVLSKGDDYLSLSTSMASLLLAQLVTIDLRD